jgi:hypothetical protein
MLERLYDQIDRPGNRITPQQFFSSPEAAQLLDQQFGGLSDRIPPGSQIVNQTPSKITYRDADGYEHTLTRKPDGEVTQASNRPAILPNRGQQQFTEQLQSKLQGRLNQPTQFASLPPELQQQLDAISAAERGDIQKQAGDLRGQLVAQLYANKVNQSSIADDQSARFVEALGRVQQQQQAGAAQRSIGLQQYLTDLIQRQGEGEASLYGTLTGQGTQRDIAGAGLDVELKKLAESSRQFNAQNYLQQLQQQLEQEKLDTSRGPLAKTLGISQIALNLSRAAGGGLSAYSALTGGK